MKNILIRTFYQLTLLLTLSLPALSQVQVEHQDSIIFNKDGYFYKNGVEIPYKEVMEKLKSVNDDSINFLIKKHDRRYITAGSLAAGGGFIIGMTLANDQFDEGQQAVLMTMGVGVLVTAVIHGRSRFKLTNKAVMRYNRLLAIEKNKNLNSGQR